MHASEKLTPIEASRSVPVTTVRRMRRLLQGLVIGWTTPRKLRVARALLVLMCLLAGAQAVYGARVRVDAAQRIGSRTEPLAADAIEVYRSMADADATLASEFLPRRKPVRARYDEDIARAAASLARAGNQSGQEGLTADRIADITVELPLYTGLAEQARADSRLGSAGGVDALLRASELMQSRILRRAEALQRDEAERLDDQYRRARSVPTLALASSVVTLAMLVLVQVFLFRKTKRVFNIGLVTSTVTVVCMLLWWTVALVVGGNHLENSQRHSQSVTDALGPSHIAALQARASEMLALVASDRSSYEEDFSARLQRLARNDGAGGGLGAALRLASGANGRELVEAAVDQTRVWSRAHRQGRAFIAAGRADDAVAFAIDTDRAGTAAAFNQLDVILARAVAEERDAFIRDIHRSHRVRTGLAMGMGLLGLVSAVAAALGLTQRLEEYR